MKYDFSHISGFLTLPLKPPSITMRQLVLMWLASMPAYLKLHAFCLFFSVLFLQTDAKSHLS